MRSRWLTLIAGGALTALLPLAAAQGSGGADGARARAAASPPIDISANGDIINSYALAFVPAEVSAHIGQVVRWTNTDFLVPHTATEDHGLWNLAGDYGQTPINPPGFPPNASVSRAFEAGTAHYYCKVHPVQMHGVIAVPVELSVAHQTTTVAATPAPVKKARKKVHHPKRHTTGTRHKRRPVKHHPLTPATPVTVTSSTITATWSSRPPAAGQVFDVQIQQGSGPWQDFRVGTSDASGSFSGGAVGSTWQVRARLRSATNAAVAEDWSPLASIQA